MKTVILLLTLAILTTGYMVATRATAMVTSIKTSQQYQLNCIK